MEKKKRRRSERRKWLGRPRSQLGRPQSQLGCQLGGPESLEGTRGGPDGQTETKTEKIPKSRKAIATELTRNTIQIMPMGDRNR